MCVPKHYIYIYIYIYIYTHIYIRVREPEGYQDLYLQVKAGKVIRYTYIDVFVRFWKNTVLSVMFWETHTHVYTYIYIYIFYVSCGVLLAQLVHQLRSSGGGTDASSYAAWRHLLSFHVAGVALRALGWLCWRAWTALVAGDAAGNLRGRRGTWRRRTWWHPPSFHVAGVALGDIHLRFARQAWHLGHWAGSGDALGLDWSPVTPRHFAWQAWHLATSTFVSRGRRGTWWHPPSFHVAGATLGDIDLRFAWQAWRLGTGRGLVARLDWSAVTLRHLVCDKVVCDKVVCDKVVCQRWCVTKWCLKDGVWKMVCDNVMCERWCVKDGMWQSWRVKDGVWQCGVWKMVCDKVVCDKVVCQRWCVTKWCVKGGVWKMVCVCDNVMCERWCMTVWKVGCDKEVCERWCVKDGVCDKVGVWKMVCDKVGVWQSCVWKMVCDKVGVKDGVVKDGVWKMVCDGVWQMVCEGWCGERWCETKWCVKDGVWKMVCDGVWKMVCDKVAWKMVCQRWFVKDGVSKMVCDKVVCDKEGGCRQVPHLPRKTKVDVTKCHACHVKWRWMSPSGTPASPATNPVQARHQSQPSALSATPATQNEGGCHQVPRLPRETKMDVTKCHACQAKCRGVTGDQSSPRAPPEPAQCPKCHACHAKRRWMSPSATPATWNEGGCRQVPCLPGKVPRRHRRPVQSKRATRASPVPRLPRKTKVDVTKCHACHAKCRGVTGDQSSPSAPPEPAQCP